MAATPRSGPWTTSPTIISSTSWPISPTRTTPTSAASCCTRAGGPDLPYYDELGRQGYRLASQHRLAERFGVASIYRAAAARFPALRQAFNRLSDRVFFPDVATPEKILRNL